MATWITKGIHILKTVGRRTLRKRLQLKEQNQCKTPSLLCQETHQVWSIREYMNVEIKSIHLRTVSIYTQIKWKLKNVDKSCVAILPPWSLAFIHCWFALMVLLERSRCMLNKPLPDWKACFVPITVASVPGFDEVVVKTLLQSIISSNHNYLILD